MKSRRRNWIVFSVMTVACALTFLSFSGPESPHFLERAQLVKRYKAIDREGFVVSVFTLRGDSDEVARIARRDLRIAIEPAIDSGAVELVVPRTRDGQIDILFPPEQVVKITAGRTVLNARGDIEVRPDPSWSTVVVQDYRRPSVLDAFGEWLRRTVRV